MSIVVSDTSPIRALEFIGQLHLLEELFGEVYVPPAVEAELRAPAIRYRSLIVQDFPFLKVVTPTAQEEVIQLRETLDRGEAEALVLAGELSAQLILVDELLARAEATRRGFGVVGTLGILVQAKQEKLIKSVNPFLGQLTEELGFFVSAKLRLQVLKQAGEA